MGVTKKHILSEIRRLTNESGGQPPGIKVFRRATGIKDTEWFGRYWPRWSEAVTEAGYPPNSWQQEIPEEELLERLANLALELGRFPVKAELMIKKKEDPTFPSHPVYQRRYGSLRAAANALFRYAEEKDDQALASICKDRVARTSGKRPQTAGDTNDIGSVYLMKSGAFFKIGRSNATGRRKYEIGIQLPETPKLVHEIKTDYPAELERYWHKRFANKRKNGEWFQLDADDVRCFKRRQAFIFDEYFH